MRWVQRFLLLLLSTLFATCCFASVNLEGEAIMQLKQQAALLADEIKQHPPQIATRLPSMDDDAMQVVKQLESNSKAHIQLELHNFLNQSA